MNHSSFQAIETAIQALQEGKPIILTDSFNRENEGDFVFPAEKITPDIMNFIIQHGCGIVCVSLCKEQLQRLQLPLMLSPEQNTTPQKTAFTIPVDAKKGVSTGVSATDRAKTIQVLMDPQTQPEDLVRPGHIYPLQAETNGVLARQGHTEGSIDIVRLAGFQPAAVICEVMATDGNIIKNQALLEFAQKWSISCLCIEDLVKYRLSFHI